MRKGILPALAALLAVTLPATAEARNGCGNQGQGSRGPSIVALTGDQRLICLDSNNSSNPENLGRITGLSNDSRIVGIDFRPATRELWGLGNSGGLYVLDLDSGDATFKSQLSVPLAGTSFGIDFNPTVDRLRIVSDSGQNLRVNVDTGAVTVDGNLTNPDPATGITGVAYTNNDADANTGTTLYGIDTRLDQLVIQAPPNAGSLNATGKLTVDAPSEVGFDIYSRRSGGTTADVEAFAAWTSDGRTRLYRINLFTGRATARGSFRAQDGVIDIAIPLS